MMTLNSGTDRWHIHAFSDEEGKFPVLSQEFSELMGQIRFDSDLVSHSGSD